MWRTEPGKPCLPTTGEYALGNCRDRQKKSFLLLPPFPQKRKSWEGLVLLARRRPAVTASGKLVKGRRRRATAFSRALSWTSKARSARHAVSAPVTKETAPDNPAWKHPHPVPTRNACPLKVLRISTELASFHYARTDNTTLVKFTQQQPVAQRNLEFLSQGGTHQPLCALPKLNRYSSESQKSLRNQTGWRSGWNVTRL